MSEEEIKNYHHFKIETKDGIELDLIETKYCQDLLDLYNKEKEKNKRLMQCHLQYEEMTGIDLLLPDKEE